MFQVHGCYASAQGVAFYAALHAVLRYCEKGMLWLSIGGAGLLFAVKEIMMIIGRKVPNVTFRTRVRDEAVGGPNPFRWQDLTSDDYFKGKKVVLFSLPGAFTPTCSTYQLPDFEKLYSEFKAEGVDEIYCISVNDAFVMNAWGKSQGLENVKLIPDGSGEFTRKMGMLVAKDNLGFGMRSWRYGAVINDGVVEQWFEEEGYSDNCDSDPYGVSSPQNILEKLKEKKAA